jgi:hypothetical protein
LFRRCFRRHEREHRRCKQEAKRYSRGDDCDRLPHSLRPGMAGFGASYHASGYCNPQAGAFEEPREYFRKPRS